MNKEIERMLLIAYSMGVDNTKWADSGEDKTSLQQAEEWLDTAKWDGTLEQPTANKRARK